MYTDSEAIVLKQVKTVGGRRMIVLFSQKYGRISAGTSISEKGKSKSALALRPFAYGRYELFKNKESYNINGAEVLESHYSLGENVDKFFAASTALEITDLLLPEEQPAPYVFKLLLEFLQLLEKRKSSYDTLLVAYEIKLFSLMGAGIQMKCQRCGKTEKLTAISVADGGCLCGDCLGPGDSLNPLIFDVGNDIINATVFIDSHPLRSLENLKLPAETENKLKKVLKCWLSYHFGVEKLKSEGLKI